MIDHAPITDPELQARVRQRYESEMASLQGLGFRVLGFALEREGPFSAILQLPALFLMLVNHEFLTLPAPLRIGVATPLLIRSDPSTVALCMGKGLKLYTRFSDGTILISSTFYSFAVPKPTSKIIKPPPSPTIEAAWRSHQEQVGQLGSGARQVQPITTYAGFVELSRLEEDLSQYE